MVELLVLVIVTAAAALAFAAWSRRGAGLRLRLDAIGGAPTEVAAPEPAPSAFPARIVFAIAMPAAVAALLAATGILRGAALLPLVLALAGVGLAAPGILARVRARRRRTDIVRSLPDVLDLLVICVEAGLGLNAAFQRVSEHIALAAPALSGIFRGIHQQIQAGRSREEALRSMAATTGAEELRSLSILLIQTDRLGTSVAAALRIHAEALRSRFHHAAEARAARSAVYLSFPLVLCIFPALLAVVVGPAAVKLLSAIGGKP